MLFRKLNIVFLFALFFCVFALSNVQAAELNIAVVDVEGVLEKSSAAESIRKQVADKREGFLKEVKGEEDKLRVEQKKIEDQRGDLSQEEFIKKAQEFEKGRLEARKKIQETKNKLDKAYAEAMNDLTKVIYDVCQEISDERSYDLVITRQTIIVGNMSLDITKEVIERMNKKLPNIKLQVK